MKDDQYILKKYLDVAAHREKNMRRQGGKYQFFCPVCGDDKEWGNRNPRGALILMNSYAVQEIWTKLVNLTMFGKTQQC